VGDIRQAKIMQDDPKDPAPQGMEQPTNPGAEPEFTLSTSAPRRVIALTVLVALGALLVYLALARPPEAFGWRIFLLGFGLLVLVQAERFRRASRLAIELRDKALVDSAGRLICRIDEIRSIQRGAFAFKPSNGFTLLLDRAHGMVWAPGLWWRIGRRVGVGGVTPVQQTKALADHLAMDLARRDGRGAFGLPPEEGGPER
jgi:hypothetical protein